MTVLVDTSVWIDYFRLGEYGDLMDDLISEDMVVINDLVLTELLPLLLLKNEKRVVALLRKIKKLPFRPNWPELIDYQVRCLRSGSNGIGMPDLLIAQNSIQNDVSVFTLDKHFKWMQQANIGIRLYG